MDVSAPLQQLVERVARYWAGEARVFAAYWTWEKRTRETDRRWLALQCSKELWGSGLATSADGLLVEAARDLIERFPALDRGISRRDLLARADGLRAELAHYCAFADAHDALAAPGESALDPHPLREAWEEDRALARLRVSHRAEDPRLGARAARLTEGGYCTLFASGMALAPVREGPHARADALIATACRGVHQDEFEHMLAGIAGIEEECLGGLEWRTLERMAVEQARARIEMRNAQFSRPLAPEALAEALAGACAPLAFDWAAARAAAARLTPYRSPA